MTASSSPTPARVLLNILNPSRGSPTPTDAVADKAMSDFLSDISILDSKHNRNKVLTQDQLAEQIFGRSRVFKDERSAVPFFRYHLRAAFNELKQLDQEIRAHHSGYIKYSTLMQYDRVIRDYLFDLREVLVFLQRNVDGWTFFDGGKNPDVSSWEVFVLARGLAHQSTYIGTGSPFDHKTAQIASIFVLRQAMELRFERLISVYPIDPKGKPPKLRHGFHQDFIVNNPQFFQANGFNIKGLRNLYDWCSEIVHQVYQPYAWQISMALRRGGNLLRSQSAPQGKAWSIYNAVTIIDVIAMQTAFENHFLATYGHGTWQMTRERPEALVPNWQPAMAFTAPTFRAVINRPGLWKRIKTGMKRFFLGLRTR